MNKKIGIIGTLLAVLVLMAVVAVVPAGADPVNATTTIVSNISYLGTSAAGSSAANGGNITQVDLNITSSTTKWQGYYGNITGELALGSSPGKTMFQWNLTSVAGEVFAARDGAMTHSNWTGLENRTGSQIDTDFGFTPGDSDSATKTFINTSTPINISGITYGPNATSAVNTSVYGGAPTWETIALANSSNPAIANYVFAGVIINNGTAYDNTQKDFQMIVPVENGTQTYYFYVELT